MTVAVDELELPTLGVADDPTLTVEEVDRRVAAVAGATWIARNPFGFSILHYDDVVAILRDKRFHSATGQLLELQGIDDPAWLARRRTSILSAEGDEHTRLRRLVGPAFSPRRADRLRPSMRRLAERLAGAVVAGGAGRGVTDLAVEFCEPYPVPIICELFGAPAADWRRFSGWASDIFRVFDGNLRHDMPAVIAAQDELDAYVGDLIEQRRSNLTDDLISALISVEAEGDRLSHEELVMMCEAVLLAGTDTTRNQLGCSIWLFARHPDQWRRLADDPDLAPRAVEETMRYFGTVRRTGRIASEDIEYRDVLFPKGTFVAPALAQANHDPSVFAEPDRFDITRPPSGKPQLTFGAGIHACLGAALARAEQQEALKTLAARLPTLEPAGPPRWKPATVGIFGPQQLPIRWTASS